MQPKAVTTGMLSRSRQERVVSGAVETLSVMVPSVEELEPVAHLEQAGGADRYGDQEYHALEQRLPQRIEIEDEQQIADRAKGERSEDGAHGAAAAAEQRHPAQHHGGDREQRVGATVRGRGLAGIGKEGEEYPAHRREHARQHVSEELGAA